MNAPTPQQKRAELSAQAIPAGRLRLLDNHGAGAVARSTRPLLGDMLVARGALEPGDLVRALALQAREETRLGDILLTHNLVAETDLLSTLAEQWRAEAPDLARHPPDTRLIDALGVSYCLRHGLVPWRRSGLITVVASARPEKFAAQRNELETVLGPVALALTTEEAVAHSVTRLRSTQMLVRAETRVPEALSCRGLDTRAASRWASSGLVAALALALIAPLLLFAMLFGWALLTLVAGTGLKVAGLVQVLSDLGKNRQSPALTHPSRIPSITRLPVVSVMVPLYREQALDRTLLPRLERLQYPRELTDIVLVTEAHDHTTLDTLARTRLPRWIRCVTVPRGGVQTKPRAMNYALDFCRGRIVGVWDAEDAPEPDQLHKVVRRFHERGPEVACLQGALDYYNTGTNWLSRCFTVEYASWFRVILPGLQRLGLPIPLGGTTLFFRRDALEALGAWDAHNVTEDADLGLRLARQGLRTEMIDTVTLEEANCRVWPWIKQRSRWLKGYALTWAVHMRDPRALWHDLGPRQFWGFQVLFLGSLSATVLAPLLWSCWLLALALPHPLGAVLGPASLIGLVALFVMSEAVTLLTGLVAVHLRGPRRLMSWVPTLHLYYPLAALAAYKALYELVSRPFFWDKTVHGLHGEAADASTPVEPDQ